MKILCEMLINDLFRLSSGHVAFVGRLEPNIDYFVPSNSKADLYVSGKNIKTINIVGEDRFSGVDESKRQDKRSIRTDSVIPTELSNLSGAKLIIYE